MKFFLFLLLSFSAFSNTKLLKLLKTPDHFAMIRHALAPGTGDPSNFELNDCNTQRNLNDEGKQQAKNIGRLFKSLGIEKANVYSSKWCRCLETARLMNLGDVKPFDGLNSFFGNWTQESTVMRMLNEFIKRENFMTPTILVTHQVVMTSLTKEFPRSGEIYILKKTEKGVDLIGKVDTL